MILVMKTIFHMMGLYAFMVFSNQKACLAMVFIQFLYAGMALLSKAALNEGMSYLVFVVYRQAMATLALAPFACILERRKASPLSFIVFCKIFLLSLCGLTLSMDLYYMALRHTSATFACASVNIIPGITFVVAILLRIETINVWRIYGQCKILGVVLCVTGAVVLSLYQGPPLNLLHWHTQVAPSPGGSAMKENMSFLKGPLLMFASFISWSLWFVMQKSKGWHHLKIVQGHLWATTKCLVLADLFEAEMLKAYPAKLLLTTLQCLLSTIQSGVAAVALDRNLNSWKLGWNLQLVSVVYCGVFIGGVSYWLQIWCIEKKGPVYVAMFSPLSVIITAILAALLWAELLYFGSVLGGALILIGLYCVIWGKSKEIGDLSHENAIIASGTTNDKLDDVESG